MGLRETGRPQGGARGLAGRGGRGPPKIPRWGFLARFSGRAIDQAENLR